MKIYCVHCGQPIEGEAPSLGQELNCPACGKATAMPASPENREPSSSTVGGQALKFSRLKRRDLAIGAGALLLLALLAFLLLRPEHSTARRWVFGDLGSPPSPSSRSGAASPSSSPGSAPGPGSDSPAQPSPGRSASGSVVATAGGQPGGTGPDGSLQSVPDDHAQPTPMSGSGGASGGASGGGGRFRRCISGAAACLRYFP